MHRNVGRPGAVLVYSLLVLSTLLIVVTSFSLYVTRANRALAVASDTAVATYVAESAVEEGLFLLRRKGISIADISDPSQPLGSIASSTAGYDAEDLAFTRIGAYAELRGTSTVSEILLDVPQDDVAFADVYDASGAPDLVGSGVGSVKLEWGQGSGAGWLETSLVELNAAATEAELKKPRTQVLGPSFHTGYCISDLQVGGTVNLHRFRFRALFDSVRSLRVTGYFGSNCTGASAALPGRSTVSATGRYHQAKQTVQISMPQQTLPSGLFGFVVFSDQSLIKLSAGVGNLQFLPQIPNGFRWPDGATGEPATYRFTYPLSAGVPSEVSSTVGLRSDFFGTDNSPAFVLVNTDRSGSFNTGEILLSVDSQYDDKVNRDDSFATVVIGDQSVVDEPLRPGATDRIKRCLDLEVSGVLRLDAFNTPPTDILDGDGDVIGSYYTDRCAVGVRLNPNGVTANDPLRGRLMAYADPGGTASVALQYNPPVPQVRLEREQPGGTWVGVADRETYSFGGVEQGQSTTTDFRICNVGTPGTTLQLSAGSVAVNGDSAFTRQPPVGSAASLARVPNVEDCGSGGPGDAYQFSVQFSPTQPIAYSGYVDVQPTNATPLRLDLTGSSEISAPDWDGNWDCWGIGDSPAATDPGGDDNLNEISCEWTNFPGVDHYELVGNPTCVSDRSVGNEPYSIQATVQATGPSAVCTVATCTYSYDVSGDTAASAADDVFRCHQVRAVDSAGRMSAFTTVRGTTGANVSSPSVKRFFAAYSHVSTPVSTRFSGNLAIQDPGSPDTWVGGANYACTQWAQTKLGISGNFKAWLCGSGYPCQNLTGSRTYVWVDSGPSHLPGVSFRTDSSGVPPNDFWRGGVSLSCVQNNPSQPSDCRTERRHVLSESTYDRAMFFRTGRQPTGDLFDPTAQSCIPSVGQSWSVASDVSGAHFGIAGRFGPQRWFTTTAQQGSDVPGASCTDSERFGIYCYEEAALTGAPSSLAITWISPFRFTANWLDGVSGETSYRVGISTPASWSNAALPANSTTLVDQNIRTQCSLVRNVSINPWVFYVDATDGTSWTTRSVASAVRPGWETPTNVRVQWNSQSQVTILWNDETIEESGFVARLVPQSGATQYVTTSAHATAAVFSSLTQGTQYTASVRAYVNNDVCPASTRYIYGSYSSTVTFTQPSSVKKIINSSAHNGNFEDDDGNVTNGNWYVSADALCQASPGVPAGSKAMMWYRPGGGPNALRPGTVTTNGTTYVNPNNVILFRASSDNNVPSTALGPSECNSGSCTNYFTGRGSWNDQSDCATWSFGGGGGTAAIVGLYYSPTQWTQYSPTHYSCASNYKIYCVEQ